MNALQTLRLIAEPLAGAVQIEDGYRVRVLDPERLRRGIQPLLETAVFATEPQAGLARWLLRQCAQEVGIFPASIHELYAARGRGQARTDYTIPALNLRALPYHAARLALRTCSGLKANAIIFEIARSEIGYTDQRPAEYSACLFAAAMAEGYRGPLFIQGDHFQVSAKRYAADPEAELHALCAIVEEAIAAGFFNIDIDTSTLVDLRKPTIPEQQATNYHLCAECAAHIRGVQPHGLTVSIGGEIGEVGGHNSTEPELRAFMQGFTNDLSQRSPGAAGISKISIQTGTSHGGVVLPDGSMAQVKVDFGTIKSLSRIAREEFGLAGAVQHGASTLPLEAFARFPEAGTCEVHLATNFQNILYEHLPPEMRGEMYAFIDKEFVHERKPNQTDEQFHYEARKRALGPYKRQLWQLPQETVRQIESLWESQFQLMFDRLNIQGTRSEVDQYIKPTRVPVPLSDYAQGAALDEGASEMAD